MCSASSSNPWVELRTLVPQTSIGCTLGASTPVSPASFSGTSSGGGTSAASTGYAAQSALNSTARGQRRGWDRLDMEFTSGGEMPNLNCECE
ncbi:MAG: hypothetical protein LKM32_09795 [Chiayiivirga sp.]|jgi:hypothetical protein|uniref:hypothetical protein n=1 Tax=Chiayiivirga sp. TaxID=2041042 RepID=UPI0025BE5681|nr:hypothetical protein [Chiayiivirga sp.]MCI1729647.1 hypothetical protein [Chiayiivirga sp.]